jgi:hypothetical protein
MFRWQNKVLTIPAIHSRKKSYLDDGFHHSSQFTLDIKLHHLFNSLSK